MDRWGAVVRIKQPCFSNFGQPLLGAFLKTFSMSEVLISRVWVLRPPSVAKTKGALY